MAATITKFKLVFFVPPNSLKACQTAIFAVGAGRYPGYTECCFTSRGTGQFRPGQEANPHVRMPVPAHEIIQEVNSVDVLQIGSRGELEEVDEYRVEAMCLGRDIMVKAVEALKK